MNDIEQKREAAKQRVAKLMAMAADNSGASDNERETALRQAEAMMRKHGISLIDIQGPGGAPAYDWDTGFYAFGREGKGTTKVPDWFQWIAVGVAKFTDTIVTLSYTRDEGAGVVFKGEVGDTAFALWLIEYLKASLRNATRAAKLNGSSERQTFRKSMALGLVNRMTILRRERDQAFADTKAGTALVVVNRKIALRDEQFGGEKYRSNKRDVSLRDGDAARKGFAAARDVQFNKPIGDGTTKPRITNKE